MSQSFGKRPLQPAVRSQREPTPPSPTERSSGKRLSTACTECKRKKIKCSSGPPPCAPCVTSNTESECFFDEQLDKRRKVAAKKTFDELQTHRDLLSHLIESLRSFERPKVDELIQLIRNNASFSDISAFLEAERSLSEHLDASISPGGRIMRERSQEMDMSMLPTSPWTKVTSDSRFVSYLAASYFAWHHPLFKLFDQEVFIRDAQAGRLGAQFCSPFLFNAILAMGCHFIQGHDLLEIEGEQNLHGKMFYEEAKRSWDEEAGRASFPSISGLMLMSQLAYMRGLDKLGLMYASQANLMYRDMGLQQKVESSVPSLRINALDPEERARSTTIWGFAFAHSLLFYTMLMPARSKLPNIPRPSSTGSQTDAIWYPFPKHEPSIPAQNIFVFDSLCKLTDIMLRVQNRVFDTEDTPSKEQYRQAVHDGRTSLEEWQQNLPSVIIGQEQPTSHFICLQLVYHFVYIGLLLRARHHGFEDNRPSDRSFLRDCLSCKVTSARAIAALCNQHSDLYGLYGKPFMITQAACMSILVLLEDLGNPDSRKALIDMCVVLRAICASVYVAKGFLRMVKPTASTLGVTLPPETQELLDDFEKVEWDNRDFHQFSSGFPNYALEENFVSDDSFQMEDLLKKFEGQARLRLWE